MYICRSNGAEDFTFFYSAQSPFSHWYPSVFTYRNVTFCCGEQFMMFTKAMLFNDMATAQAILETPRPEKHKQLGRQVRNFNQTAWDEKCRHYVYIGNREKFTQNPELAQILLSTTGRLVEASPTDKIWGIGLPANHPDAIHPEKWPGENRLGQILTELREQMRHALHQDSRQEPERPSPRRQVKFG